MYLAKVDSSPVHVRYFFRFCYKITRQLCIIHAPKPFARAKKLNNTHIQRVVLNWLTYLLAIISKKVFNYCFTTGTVYVS